MEFVMLGRRRTAARVPRCVRICTWRCGEGGVRGGRGVAGVRVGGRRVAALVAGYVRLCTWRWRGEGGGMEGRGMLAYRCMPRRMRRQR
eukprot:364955-Chlamydomonas_euryale.AAC.35